MTDIYFNVKTPLGVEVRATAAYWRYFITVKHPILKDKEDIVTGALQYPDVIRRSRIDKEVFLYYRQFDRLYCVVAKHTESGGFFITAYPADKIKEGEIIWTR